MKNIRRLIGTALLGMGLMGGNAFADSIVQTGTFGPSTTDFSWSINVAKFTVPVGYHLTGITVEVTGSAASSPFTLTNTSAGVQNFGINFSSFISINSNSASPVGVGNFFSLPVFTTGGPSFAPTPSIVLGPTGSGPCPDNTPSVTCNAVSYTTASANGSSGILNVAALNWASYLGAGNVTLGGVTNSVTTFNGGGGNINLTQTTTASIGAAITYFYALDEVPGVPEPATMTLMGAALVGIGLLRKRIRQ